MTLDTETERKIREKIEKKFEAKGELQTFAVVYVMVIPLLWGIWFITGGNYFMWPLIPMMGMTIPLVIMTLKYYYEHGAGANRRERMIDAEMERERERLGGHHKLKNDSLYDDEDPYFYDASSEDSYEASYDDSDQQQLDRR